MQCLDYSPATVPEKELDERRFHTVGEPQEEGMMSTVSSFSVRNQGLIDQQEKGVTSEGVAS